LSKRTIVSLIGIDYSLLKEAGEENIHKFYTAGLFVISILLLSFFSVFYAFELMFHKWYAEIFLALFFSLMFFTIYVLLIQTFSKEVLPKTQSQPFFNLSNLSRMGFVFLISFIISQPIKIFLFRDKLEVGVSSYKNQLFNSFNQNLDLLYSNDRDKLSKEKSRQVQIYGTEHLSVKAIDKKIQFIEDKMLRERIDVYAKISSSDFFVRRILLSNQYSSAWLISAVIIAIFGIPVFLIYSISSNNRYYLLKKSKEFTLVNNHYNHFKNKYSKVFSSKFSITGITFYESYLDAPFNTIKKMPPPMLSQEDFKNHFLS
jgi:hypothetical protein